MFDIGFYEFLVIGLVLFLVLPAGDFPKTMRWIIQSIRKIKTAVADFAAQFESPMDEFKNVQQDIERESKEIKKRLKGKSKLR